MARAKSRKLEGGGGQMEFKYWNGVRRKTLALIVTPSLLGFPH